MTIPTQALKNIDDNITRIKLRKGDAWGYDIAITDFLGPGEDGLLPSEKPLP
jgi:hypothetical protein